ncbi:MAG: preprotein translocase subunit SecY [Anaerolineales bacterium]|jgi:preprotein translocase subunit SecY|nr:preprotein translocase subunit SecY [Anaerolineales bacterium]
MKRSSWRYLWTSQDIRRKLLITILLLSIYRLAAHVPVPGVDRAALTNLMQSGGAGGTLVGLLDLLSGGTVSNFSVLAMGVYPYITAQIILQLLVPIIPSLQKRMEEDPREGQKWMEKWTYILAVPMAALQAIGQINIFNSLAGTPIISEFAFIPGSIVPSLAIVLSMTAGTMFAIWLGELISEFGIRNQGLSLIIFAGIVARIPANFAGILADETYGWWLFILTILITVLTIFAIVFVQQGRRNVPVMYPGRRVGNRMSMPVKGTLPLMVNMAGMIPLIFAQSLLTFPAILGGFFANSKIEFVRNVAVFLQRQFGGTSDFYWIMYFVMVVAFTFFYTNVLFTQQNYGENLKRVGAQIPGVSRGAATQRYLNRVLSRITLPGALFLGLVAVMPWLISLIVPQFGSTQSSSFFLISSAGLLIVVGVVRDTFFNIQAELKLHGYDDALLIR